ncbi:MAG: hypothetical protein ACREOS_09400 [Candidatus Dormibacteraceae bacterium]
MIEPDDLARELVEERDRARHARDFELADRIRDRLGSLGWAALDAPDGTRLEALAERIEVPDGKPSQLQSPDRTDFSVILVLYGWPEDVRRLLSGLGRGSHQLELIAVDISEQGIPPPELGPRPPGVTIRVLRPTRRGGHASALNAAIHQAWGRIVCLIEPSLEFGPNTLSDLDEALSDPQVGLAGPFGLRNFDEHHFEPSPGGAADALEYLLAFRRRDAARIGDIDRRFRYYRNFDLDFSYQVRAAGLRIKLIEATGVVRHQHRVWESTPVAERDRLSRRNFNLWMDHWVRAK